MNCVSCFLVSCYEHIKGATKVLMLLSGYVLMILHISRNLHIQHLIKVLEPILGLVPFFLTNNHLVLLKKKTNTSISKCIYRETLQTIWMKSVQSAAG